jgi:hypothetical protein
MQERKIRGGGSLLRQATPERNIGASLDIRPQASSVVYSSQIESTQAIICISQFFAPI